MRIGLFHGYELTGSGSNEYTRYLARSLAEAGHEVHVICREERAADIPFVTDAYAWDAEGTRTTLFESRGGPHVCCVHQLPHGRVRPVYLTDKQRKGNVKSFITLTDDELDEYHRLNETLLTRILGEYKLDVLHANHLVYQPVSALEACRATRTPLMIFPHGSSIEYTVKRDERYKRRARKSVVGCTGLITGNREVRDRILNLYPDDRETILAKNRIVGVGVDTSLFKPIDRSEREHSIGRLIATQGGGGKSPRLKEELRERVLGGDIEATQAYWDSYDHSMPDADLSEQLQAVPWQENILIFVGALTVGKGVQSLITALPGVLHEHPATHLFIVGAGAYREVLEALVYAIAGSKREIVRRLCAKGYDLDRGDRQGAWLDVRSIVEEPAALDRLMKHGRTLADRVHFLGRLDHSRLRFLFPCADLAVFPSVIPEAYPLVLMEALANGVLPMVSYFSGFKDGVDELRPMLGDALVEKMKIPVDNDTRITALTARINDLLSQKNEIASERLQRIAVENYDWKLRATQMATAYTDLIRGSQV